MSYHASVVANTQEFIQSATDQFWARANALAAPAPEPRPSWWIDFSRVPVNQAAETALKKCVFATFNMELFEGKLQYPESHQLSTIEAPSLV